MTSPEQLFGESNLLNNELLEDILVSHIGAENVSIGIHTTSETGTFTDPFDTETNNLSLIEQLIAQEKEQKADNNNTLFPQFFNPPPVDPG